MHAYNYKLLSIGVNHVLGAKSLQYAEKDAEDIANLFRSGLGPLNDADIYLHTNNYNSLQSIQDSLLHISRLKPTHFIFYFSGHGSNDGIMTANGKFHYSNLRDYIRYINAPYTIIILDVCNAASYIDFLKEAYLADFDAEQTWIEVLSQATPGTRLIFSTGKTKLAGEGGIVENGHFTYAFIQALQYSQGDIVKRDKYFISDKNAFYTTKNIMQKMQLPQIPVAKKLSGDFPIILSQVEHPLGKANFTLINVEQNSLRFKLKVNSRRFLHTKLVHRIVNSVGEIIYENTIITIPEENEMQFKGTLTFPSEAVSANTRVQIERYAKSFATIHWQLYLVDAQKRVITQHVVPCYFN